MHQELAQGQVLGGKYVVEGVIGEGGMGIVVAARHLQLHERVAIKVMRPESLANGEALARFAREARAAFKIKSEHVGRVIDVGALENGAPYIVMEYLEGLDLSSWLRQRGRLSAEQAVEFVLQASEAVAEAHALGIVHRDLKPANLFVIRRPEGSFSVKVLDFGISKVTGGASMGLDLEVTKTGATFGSPFYMSPEQTRGTKDSDARSDIWALGVILYELLTGERPFKADALPDLVMQIAFYPPAPLRKLAPEAPPRLEGVILKCLEKDAANRFATVGELGAALLEFGPLRSRLSVERIAGVLQSQAPSSTVLVSVPLESVSARDQGMAASLAPSRRERSRVLLGAAALLPTAIVAFIAYRALVASEPPPPAILFESATAPASNAAAPASNAAAPASNATAPSPLEVATANEQPRPMAETPVPSSPIAYATSTGATSGAPTGAKSSATSGAPTDAKSSATSTAATGHKTNATPNAPQKVLRSPPGGRTNALPPPSATAPSKLKTPPVNTAPNVFDTRE